VKGERRLLYLLQSSLIHFEKEMMMLVELSGQPRPVDYHKEVQETKEVLSQK
jgi:hypothetical protein